MRIERATARGRLAAEPGGPVDPDASDDAEESETSLAKWLPDALPTGRAPWLAAVRADPGRAGALALAVVGAIAVAITVVTLARDDPPPVTAVNLPQVQMASAAPAAPGVPAASGTAAAADQAVVVSVAGLVQHPGLVTLPPGSRVDDALSAAGGVLDGADLLGLNVARRVTDGEQIVVGIASPPGAPPAMGSSVAAPAAAGAGAPATGGGGAAGGDVGSGGDGPVNLNTATVERLDELPGVGPVTAAAIVAWREANGRFTDVEQLGDVDGIGPARLEKLRGLVVV